MPQTGTTLESKANYSRRGKHASHKPSREAWEKRGRVYGAAAGQLVQDVAALKRLINVEKKYWLSEFASTAYSDNPYYASICIPAQGDDKTDRNGDSIKVISIQLALSLMMGNVSTNNFNFCRICIVQDKQSNGGVPSLATLFQDTTYAYLSPRNYAYSKRYKFLYDEKVAFAASGNNCHLCTLYKDVDFHIRFSGAAGAYTTIQTNNITLWIIPDQATASGNGVDLQGYTKIRYVDN